MTALAPIAAMEFVREAKPATEFGAKPELRWLAIGDLRVDKSYQRDVLKTGLATIKRIVENFRWSRFGQLVVAKRAGGVFAIVDGQHRAVACAILRIDRVPCIVIAVDIEEEAEAFAAINGNVTRPSQLQIYHARLVAGDRKARALRTACLVAGVSVPRTATICDKPGMSTAIGALEHCLDRYGAEVLIRALKLIVGAGDAGIGMLGPTIIGGLCQVLTDRPQLVARPGLLTAAIARVGLAKLYEKAKRIQAVDGGAMRATFVDVVDKALEREQQAQAA
ncbi:MAG: DUF6551 family protein [Rhizomicrobium sp.]